MIAKEKYVNEKHVIFFGICYDPYTSSLKMEVLLLESAYSISFCLACLEVNIVSMK